MKWSVETGETIAFVGIPALLIGWAAYATLAARKRKSALATAERAPVISPHLTRLNAKSNADWSPARSDIRRIAEEHSAKSLSVARQGGNAHQIGLDQTDAVKAFAAKLTPENQVLCLNLYAEELQAIASKNITDATILNVKNATEAAGNAYAASIAGSLILFGALYLMFRYL